MKLSSRERLIFARDVSSLKEAAKWVKLLKGYAGVFKVGKELFTACGPKVVEVIHNSGAEVFLDLKFHDIPNTAAKAGIAAANLGVKMFNVHTTGGFKMMTAVSEAVDRQCRKGRQPLILGVTILTSLNEKDIKQVGIQGPIKSRVLSLAKLAHRAGLDGVVASPLEVRDIKKKLGKDFIVVTPGIRTPDSRRSAELTPKPDDQNRIMTPKQAISAGADYIVVGRPIKDAKDPVDVARKI